MRIRVHRGAHEVGGNCVEFESVGHSILLDLGLPLVEGRSDPPPLRRGRNPQGPRAGQEVRAPFGP